MDTLDLFQKQKLRLGNHNLRIENGRHSVMNIPENLRICKKLFF